MAEYETSYISSLPTGTAAGGNFLVQDDGSVVTKIPINDAVAAAAAVQALTARLDGLVVSKTVPAGGSETLTAGDYVGALLCCFGASAAIRGVYMITRINGGSIFITEVSPGSGIAVSGSGSTITISNSSGTYNMLCRLIVTMGSVTV